MSSNSTDAVPSEKSIYDASAVARGVVDGDARLCSLLGRKKTDLSVALFLPFRCNNGRQIAASARQPLTSKALGSIEQEAQAGSLEQESARHGSRAFFRLLTGGLLVRVQPEEPTYLCEFSGLG